MYLSKAFFAGSSQGSTGSSPRTWWQLNFIELVPEEGKRLCPLTVRVTSAWPEVSLFESWCRAVVTPFLLCWLKGGHFISAVGGQVNKRTLWIRFSDLAGYNCSRALPLALLKFRMTPASKRKHGMSPFELKFVRPVNLGLRLCPVSNLTESLWSWSVVKGTSIFPREPET